MHVTKKFFRIMDKILWTTGIFSFMIILFEQTINLSNESPESRIHNRGQFGI